MKCPVCKDVNLLMSEKQGIEVDYCPECRGVWLDRGELEKITEKVNNQLNDQDQERVPHVHSSSCNHDHSVGHEKKDHHKDELYDKNKPRKKESVFSNIFDIFGD